MRIGINAVAVRQLSGSSAGVYLREMLPRLVRLDGNAEYVLFMREGVEWPEREFIPNLHVEAVSLTRFPTFGRIWAEQVWLPRLARRLDLLFCPYNIAPVVVGLPCVLYVHTLMWLTRPELSSAFRGMCLGWLLRRSVEKAAAVLCASESARRDLEERVPQSCGRVRVVPHGCSPFFQPGPRQEDAAILERLRVRPPYLLTVSSIARHKDLENLVAAWERIPSSMGCYQLVIAGSEADNEYVRTLRKRIAASPRRDQVQLLGTIAQRELRALYSTASLFILASRCETFGLPAIEAMSCGCPLLASNLPAIREIIGSAGMLVNTSNEEELSSAIISLLADSDRTNGMHAASLAAARRFSWERAARQTLDVFHNVLPDRSRLKRRPCQVNTTD